MGVEAKPGDRFRSAACDGEVIVVKTPGGEIDLRCGGHPMIRVGDDPSEPLAAEPGFDGGALIGKRYTDPSGALEVLCTKAGTSAPSLGDELLVLKDAKPLPSSD